MKQAFDGWEAVASSLRQRANEAPTQRLNLGQRASLRAIAERILKNGVLVADEVGMGKTRIAVEVTHCVIERGGRVAILVPPGLGYQWQSELHEGGVNQVRGLLRSLWRYLEAWKSNDQAPNEPWFHDPVVLLSHAFTNWRLGENSAGWRWTLLPEILARWQAIRTGSYPYSYHSEETRRVLNDEWVCQAAASIVHAIPRNSRHCGCRLLDRINHEDFIWRRLLDSTEYDRNGRPREWLERVVGVGLGVFDLVVIDEAHKSRGQDSGLSRLLSHVVLQGNDMRRLALTATPVELDASQWHQTLSRLAVADSELDAVKIAIDEYAESVRDLRRTWRFSDSARAKYKASAQKFEVALSPYLLRRTKREDYTVRQFMDHFGSTRVDAYRLEKEIVVEVPELPMAWKRAICAAEALSGIVRQDEDPIAKRLRLTLGNGHGISALLDEVHRDDEADGESQSGCAATGEAQIDRTRTSRAQWWKAILQGAFVKDDAGLFDHPAILAAVEAIEGYTDRGEKVLVFGRFTRPLGALVDLLNSREMLRCLAASRPWPQAKVHGDHDADSADSEWPAVRAAHRQLDSSLSLRSLDDKLRRQYDVERRRRERLREHLVDRIQAGFAQNRPVPRVLSLFREFKSSVEASQGHPADAPQSLLSLVSRALVELLDSGVDASPQTLAQAFVELMDAVCDRDDFDEAEDNGNDHISELWKKIDWHEYDRPQGGFARLMYGKTSQASRRMIQAAFNRASSFPRVLVAQSIVGREGLNLHKACRVVVLLHPEWNPGVVEQQIGRVDRVGSRWAEECEKAIGQGRRGEDLPRIEIRPVVFRGTYDEHNWEILRERWDDLRAQLHGVVVPTRLAEGNLEDTALVDEMAKAAPNFSPSIAPLLSLDTNTASSNEPRVGPVSTVI